MSTEISSVGPALRWLRKQAGLTIEQAANMAGLSTSQVHRSEQENRSPMTAISGLLSQVYSQSVR